MTAAEVSLGDYDYKGIVAYISVQSHLGAAVQLTFVYSFLTLNTKAAKLSSVCKPGAHE